MKRGEIYFLTIPAGTTTGYEIMYSRPAIVVSCDNLASSGGAVTVVPCSSSSRSKLRCHVDIASADRDCRALVEQITTVDKSRLVRCLGRVTPDELKRIDAALINYLDLPGAELPAEEKDLRDEPAIVFPRDEWRSVDAALSMARASVQLEQKKSACETDALRAELAVYKQLYNDLLGRVIKSA